MMLKRGSASRDGAFEPDRQGGVRDRQVPYLIVTCVPLLERVFLKSSDGDHRPVLRQRLRDDGRKGPTIFSLLLRLQSPVGRRNIVDRKEVPDPDISHLLHTAASVSESATVVRRPTEFWLVAVSPFFGNFDR
ncbi:hypothetical protein CPLU01_10995 [Colletotrichum plurivorum]|uniref:Uncharacterized protein n=1 Tax=Colletotrichum plurivorum TaxID=2175906 RepID=A0A8H6N913_9PEZI|nr:hypothetical protein CPLU01_10995 [Colletotrichum plurivorum]